MVKFTSRETFSKFSNSMKFNDFVIHGFANPLLQFSSLLVPQWFNGSGFQKLQVVFKQLEAHLCISVHTRK